MKTLIWYFDYYIGWYFLNEHKYKIYMTQTYGKDYHLKSKKTETHILHKTFDKKQIV